jgi:hypothetical protein
MGLPVLRASPLCTCHRHYPGAATGCMLRSLPQPCQPSPHGCPGRPAHCLFRGLLDVHSRYGLHTCQVTLRDPLHRRLQPLRYLHDCSDCFRLERKLPGGTLTHWKDAALSRRTPVADLRRLLIYGVGVLYTEPREGLTRTAVPNPTRASSPVAQATVLSKASTLTTAFRIRSVTPSRESNRRERK